MRNARRNGTAVAAVARVEGRATPDEVEAHARQLFLTCQRIDMQAMAAELGIGRATLYRWFGSRDALLAKTIWSISGPVLNKTLQSTQDLYGRSRILSILKTIGTDLLTWEPYVAFLHREPAAALRIMTTSATDIQEKTRVFFEQVVSGERANGSLDVSDHIDSGTLAYAIVRLAEAFFYSDLIAGREPDINQALSVMGLVLGSVAPSTGVGDEPDWVDDALNKGKISAQGALHRGRRLGDTGTSARGGSRRPTE